MKKLIAIALAVVMVFTLGTSAALAASPWVTKMEGNGILSGGSLPYYSVVETDIGWNFKVKADGTVQGHLNIMEKLGKGPPRHFQLSGAEVDTVSWDGGTDELRVEGTNEDGQRVAAHFRGVNNLGDPKTVWYWVKVDGNFITDCAARLPLVGDDFTIDCNP